MNVQPIVRVRVAFSCPGVRRVMLMKFITVHYEFMWLCCVLWPVEEVFGRLGDDKTEIFGADKFSMPLPVSGVQQLPVCVDIPWKAGLHPQRPRQVAHRVSRGVARRLKENSLALIQLFRHRMGKKKPDLQCRSSSCRNERKVIWKSGETRFYSLHFFYSAHIFLVHPFFFVVFLLCFTQIYFLWSSAFFFFFFFFFG